MKKILIICLLFSASLTNAQTYFYIGKNGSVVSTKDSADFIRLVKPKDTSAGNIPVTDYYLSGKVKSRATFGNNEFIFEGQKVDYFENGKKKKSANYIHGKIVGKVYYFYPNGLFYYFGTQNTDEILSFEKPEVFVKSAKDSTGKDIVTDGNGYFIKYADNFKEILIEGKLVNSLWEDEVKGFMERDSLRFVELMSKGKLVLGTSTDKAGKIYNYKNYTTAAEYPGGNRAFQQYLGNTIKIPMDLASANLNGTIVTRFVVDATGFIVDPVTVSGLHPTMNQVVRDVIQKSKKWIPGTIRGVPVKMSYTVPTKVSTYTGQPSSPSLVDGIPKRRN